MISASQLYDFVSCPHRVWLDIHGDPTRRDEASAFVQLLWEQGIDHEQNVLQGLAVTVDLADTPVEEREASTRAAIAAGAPLIYRGRLSSGDRVGEPDLLELRNGRYVPGDIKSGAGMEGDGEDARVKKNYAFQLAHYAAILADERLGDGQEAFIVDALAARVPYALDAPQGVRNTQSWLDAYRHALAQVRALVEGAAPSLPALGATCALCHWYSHCKAQVMDTDDLTRIAELGRAKRDVLAAAFPTVRALAGADPEAHVRGKKTDFTGIGPDTLRKFHARAVLLSTPGARPYLKRPIALPRADREIWFDIEADPMSDRVYLHGFMEADGGRAETARFRPFFADCTPPAEEARLFGAAWEYLAAAVADGSAVFHYSPYERTAYKRLAAKYPQVCSVAEVEALFAQPNVIDLYEIVRTSVEFPLHNYSIKTIARYFGFDWRDQNPSGAASIEWYRRWLETGDNAIRDRLLRYNEDDCAATGAVIRGIRAI